MKAFIVYPTYRIIDNKAYVYLFGRLENGESFLTINLFKPYFWIKNNDLDKAQKLAEKHSMNFEVGKNKKKIVNFDDEEVVKIILNTPNEVPQLKQLFESEKIICYEADIRFVYRFLIDNNIKGTTNINGTHKKGNFVNRIYENPEFEEAKHYIPELKMVSFDIETNEKHNQVISISLYTKEYKKVLIVNKNKLENAISFEDEKSMLEAFREQIRKLDPDILTGWNVIDFDLAVLKERFKHYKIPFELGRAEWESKLRIMNDFFRDSTADIAGRQVLDGIAQLKNAFISLDDYKLETAAQAILGKGKLIKGNDRCTEIMELYKKDPQKLVDYNLMDSKLVYDIIEKKNLVNIAVSRSMLTGMQLDRVSGSIAALDSLYLRETKKLGIVCPNSSFAENEERIKGGFVRESTPGIYDNIIVLDFKSLYPSIIRTFNIDPYRFDKTGKKGEIVAPNKARFFKKTGILPGIIQNLWKMRDEAKKNKDDTASYAIKIHMNSFFGVLANPMCRFFNLDMANAITSYGRYIVQETAKKVEEEGYKVIYGDTDSIFVESKAKDIKDADRIGKDIQDYINRYWKGVVKKWYNVPNFLELEYEKVYKKFILPKLRGVDVGAKKRYAGILMKKEKGKDGKVKETEKLDFVGLEFVRRDWTDLAKEFQLELLNMVFHDKDVTSYVLKFIADLKKGKYDKLLVYKKALRKPIEEYTKTTPPHVKAARLLDKIDSTLIMYVMTENGPEPIQKLKSKIDYEHYIDKQLKPIADSILGFFEKKFDELVSGKKQSSLFDY